MKKKTILRCLYTAIPIAILVGAVIFVCNSALEQQKRQEQATKKENENAIMSLMLLSQKSAWFQKMPKEDLSEINGKIGTVNADHAVAFKSKDAFQQYVDGVSLRFLLDNAMYNLKKGEKVTLIEYEFPLLKLKDKYNCTLYMEKKYVDIEGIDDKE